MLNLMEGSNRVSAKTQSNQRLQRTRHEPAPWLSLVGEPLKRKRWRPRMMKLSVVISLLYLVINEEA